MTSDKHPHIVANSVCCTSMIEVYWDSILEQLFGLNNQSVLLANYIINICHMHIYNPLFKVIDCVQ